MSNPNQQPKPGFGDFVVDAISQQRNQAMQSAALAAAKAATLEQENGELRARIAALEKPKEAVPAATEVETK
jgi:hypothetical protein